MSSQELISPKEIDDLIDKYKADKSALIAVLQDIQTEFRHLPEDALRRVAQRLNIPLADVYSVATFFASFSMKPRKRTIVVCLGTACHVRGASRILAEINRRVEASEEYQEEFQVESVNCLGACALAPVVVVDGKYHGRMTIKGLDALLPLEAAG